MAAYIAKTARQCPIQIDQSWRSGNQAARALKERLAATGPLELPLTTLGEEKHFNTFFRLGNAEIIAGLREHFPELPEQPAPREVFVALRALRNKW